MSDNEQRLAIFPGTFDPLTNGHVDIIQRGAGLFDRLIVAVGENPTKETMLPPGRRAGIISEVIRDWPNVSVRTYTGLTVDFARGVGARYILRGIRNSSDLQFEYSLALTNRVVAGIETVFVIPSTEHAFTSSSLIRQVARMGGDVSAMVPPEVLPHLHSDSGPGLDAALREPE